MYWKAGLCQNCKQVAPHPHQPWQVVFIPGQKDIRMEGEIYWHPATPDNLPEEGRWVVVVNQQGPNDKPVPFPAMLVKARHGNLWRDLTAKEDEVQYAPIHRNSLWAYVTTP